MTTIVVATDHEFLRFGKVVYDTYCFDRHFFDDYSAVSDEVQVVSRVRQVATLPNGARLSEAGKVHFVPVRPIHGWRWLVGAGHFVGKRVAEAVAGADAVIARVPSQIGRLAVQEAQKQGARVGVEVIGDPLEALRGSYPAGLGSLLGSLARLRLRRIVQVAEGVSYVSRAHLQRHYPASPSALTASISSIRLSPKTVVEPRVNSFGGPERVIVTIGSLVPVKRQEDLIRAFSRAATSRPWKLMIIGGGPRRAFLEKLVAKLGVSDKVTFTGHLSNKETMTSLLDRADLFILTSSSEGLPRVILEAMARGVPVIGSKAGGIEELVESHALFEVADWPRLSQLMGEVLNDEARLAEMSVHSIRMARMNTTDVLSPMRRDFYLGLVARPRAFDLGGQES